MADARAACLDLWPRLVRAVSGRVVRPAEENPYAKSRLPGPAVRLFDLDMLVGDDETVQRSAYDDRTMEAPPEVEWALLPDCRKETP